MSYQKDMFYNYMLSFCRLYGNYKNNHFTILLGNRRFLLDYLNFWGRFRCFWEEVTMSF